MSIKIEGYVSTGRNFQEIKRVLISMQTVDKYKVATPADWQPGDDVIVPPAAAEPQRSELRKPGNKA